MKNEELKACNFLPDCKFKEPATRINCMNPKSECYAGACSKRCTIAAPDTRPTAPTDAVAERKFPLLNGAGTIPWSIAERAYRVYANQYGDSQSLERLAERGGFDVTEMDALYPKWQDDCSAITKLLAEIERLKGERDETCQTENTEDALREELAYVKTERDTFEGSLIALKGSVFVDDLRESCHV